MRRNTMVTATALVPALIQIRLAFAGDGIVWGD